jgi:DNA-binding HxlR family transcriptional regulator
VKRSYQQYCGLAAALDVVGERWALLIVRDLTPGPRRFKDLFDGLPGVATDMLAERLRSLEAAGAVEQRTVRYPVPGKLYALTGRGQELAHIAGRLARWGMPLLPDAPGDRHRTNPVWALQTMAREYAGGLPDGEYRWMIDDQVTTVVVSADGNPQATLTYGHGSTSTPVLDVHCEPSAFFTALGGNAASSDLDIHSGSQDLVSAFFAAMPLTAPPA